MDNIPVYEKKVMNNVTTYGCHPDVAECINEILEIMFKKKMETISVRFTCYDLINKIMTYFSNKFEVCLIDKLVKNDKKEIIYVWIFELKRKEVIGCPNKEYSVEEGNSISREENR